MKTDKSSNSSRTFSRLLRLTGTATLSFIIVSVMTGCGNRQRRLGIVSSTPCRNTEAAVATSSFTVGQPAPFFSLPNQQGETVSLADLKGSWVVLHFSPKDEIPACVGEATEFADLRSEFKQMNTKVFGINADTVDSQLNVRKRCGFELDFLSDPEGKMMRRYKAYGDTCPENTHSSRIVRSTFLIDENGRIAYHWPEVTSPGHAYRVKARLAQIRNKPAAASLPIELDMMIMAPLFKVFN